MLGGWSRTAAHDLHSPRRLFAFASDCNDRKGQRCNGDRARMKLSKWCKAATDKVNGHDLTVFAAENKKLTTATKSIAKTLSSHYVAPHRVAHLMKRLGRPAVATYIAAKLPTSKAIQSGDLAEILGFAYVVESTRFSLAIKRLRWKDHRNMAMRGEDILAFAVDDMTGALSILKGEVKSREALGAAAIRDARKSLSANNGRPSAHALAFVADRLYEEGEEELADLILTAQLDDRIARDQVTHLIFTLSANDPTRTLSADLREYKGQFEQLSVGVRVEAHQKFIKAIYELASGHGI